MIDHLILGVISLYPCSGYDMKMEFERGSAGLLSALSFGSIYPRLKQLEENGLVETRQVEDDGRNKKIYELTAKGWQELLNWQEQLSDYPGPTRDELLLKMLYWGASGQDRTTLVKQLGIRREESLGLLEYLIVWQSDGRSFVDEYIQLVCTYLQKKLEAELTWIDEAIVQLEGQPSLPVQDPQWLAVLQRARRKTAFGQKVDLETGLEIAEIERGAHREAPRYLDQETD